jgi:hypothetical protein
MCSATNTRIFLDQDRNHHEDTFRIFFDRCAKSMAQDRSLHVYTCSKTVITNIFTFQYIDSDFNIMVIVTYSEIFLINNCQCQNEVKNHTVPP